MSKLKHLSNKELVNKLKGIAWFYNHEQQKEQKDIKEEILKRLGDDT